MLGLAITCLVGVAAVACLVNPVAGLCGYLVTIIIRPNEWIEGVKVPAIPMMIVMMSVGYMLHMGSITPRPEEGKPLRSSSYLVAMVLLLIVHFIIFPSGYPLMGHLLGEAAPTILLLVYFTRHINTPERLQATLTTITLSSVLMAASSGFVHFFRKGPAEMAETSGGVLYEGHGSTWNSYHLHGMRLQGHGNSIWGNPNDFGMLVNWGILGCLFYLKRQGSKVLKLLSLGGIALLSSVLFLTGSRGGQLQLGINLWMVLIGGKRKALGIFLLAIALVGALVVLPKLSPERSDAGASKDERTELLMAAFRLFKSYPIYGCGFMRFPTHNDFKSLFPHNVYVQCLAETGLIGSGIFFAMLWILRRETSAAVKWFQKFAPFNDAFLAQCIGALQLSFSVFILFSNQFMRYTFALVMTLAIALYNTMLLEAERQRKSSGGDEPSGGGSTPQQPRRELEIEGELIEENVSVEPRANGGVQYVFDPRREDRELERDGDGPPKKVPSPRRLPPSPKKRG